MPTIAFALPIAPGKTDAFRAAQARFVDGRPVEFEASRRRLGVWAEHGFLQSTPTGPLAVVVFEVEDPARLFEGTASSEAPLDVDFRAYLLDVFGLDVARAPTGAPSELVFDWRVPSPVSPVPT